VYILRICVAISVLFSVLLGGRSNQTFSARNHMWRRQGKPNVAALIDALFGNGHCLTSWVYWATHRHAATIDDLKKEDKDNGTDSRATLRGGN